MFKFVSLAAAAAVALGFSFGTAQAITTIYVTGSSIELECLPPVCQGFTGAGSPGFPNPTLADPVVMSSTAADLYDVHPPTEANEALALSTLLGDPTMFDEDDAVGVLGGSGDTASFFTNAAYLAFVLGNSDHIPARTFFIALANPGSVQVFFDKMGQEGGGLSHTTAFGTSVVPLPAGLILFLTGLAGVGFLGRYKSKRGEVPTA